MRQITRCTAGHPIRILITSLSLIGCAGSTDRVARASLADTNGLVTLPQLAPIAPDTTNAPRLVVATRGDSMRLLLQVEAGDQINALQPPVLTTDNGRRIVFDAPAVTSDSSYFVGKVTAVISRSLLPLRGSLSTSYCRAGEKLCRSARRAVSVP